MRNKQVGPREKVAKPKKKPEKHPIAKLQSDQWKAQLVEFKKSKNH